MSNGTSLLYSGDGQMFFGFFFFAKGPKVCFGGLNEERKEAVLVGFKWWNFHKKWYVVKGFPLFVQCAWVGKVLEPLLDTHHSPCQCHTQKLIVVCRQYFAGPEMKTVDDGSADENDGDVDGGSSWRAVDFDLVGSGDADVVLVRDQDDEPHRGEAQGVTREHGHLV